MMKTLYISAAHLAHIWPLSTLNVSKKTKELNFKISFQFEFSEAHVVIDNRLDSRGLAANLFVVNEHSYFSTPFLLRRY